MQWRSASHVSWCQSVHSVGFNSASMSPNPKWKKRRARPSKSPVLRLYFVLHSLLSQVCFRTDRYERSPLIVKGAAAGANMAAAGIFADLLRLARAYNRK